MAKKPSSPPEAPIEPKIETPPPIDLDATIAASKVEIAESGVKRGRKPGSKKRPDGTIAAPGAPPPQTPPTSPQAASVSAAPVLKPMVIMVSTLPALRFKMKELTFTDEEAEPIAQALDGVLNAYMPELTGMNPKTAALLTLGVVVASATVGKMQVYYAIKASREPEAGSRPHDKPVTVAQPEPEPVRAEEPKTDRFASPQRPTGPPVPAGDYFKRP